MVRSVRMATIHARGQRGLQRRQQGVDSIDHVDDVRARLALHIQDQRRDAVHPAAELGVFRARHQGGDILEAHRRAVLVGDDDVAVVVGVSDLIVGVDRVGVAGPSSVPFGPF